MTPKWMRHPHLLWGLFRTSSPDVLGNERYRFFVELFRKYVTPESIQEWEETWGRAT